MYAIRFPSGDHTGVSSLLSLNDKRVNVCLDRYAAAAKAECQHFALEVFHDEEVDAVVVTDVVQRADVRMVERGNRFRLELESRG